MSLHLLKTSSVWAAGSTPQEQSHLIRPQLSEVDCRFHSTDAAETVRTPGRPPGWADTNWGAMMSWAEARKSLWGRVSEV